MSYDYGALNKKIHDLMDEKDVNGKKRLTQAALAEKLGVKPSRVTNAFKGTDGARFTLDQYEEIADALGMTLGELFKMGEEHETLTPQEVCQSLVKIYNSYKFCFEPLEISEEYWEDIDPSEPLNHSPVNVSFPYTAIYFPNVWKVDVNNEYDKRSAEHFGNLSDGCLINVFLTRMKELEDMRSKGDIEQDNYNEQIEKYLNETRINRPSRSEADHRRRASGEK